MQKKKKTEAKAKWKQCKKVVKQKSKSFDDEPSITHKVLGARRASRSCIELSSLSRISEEGDGGVSESKVYRRKLFAKSRTHQVSQSLDVPSPSIKSSTPSSLKSSNTSLSSRDRNCIIMLSSFEEKTPPIVIFPENFYQPDREEKSKSKLQDMRKQVSFDDSLTDGNDEKEVELKFEKETIKTSLMSIKDERSDDGSVTITATSVYNERHPSYRTIIFIWTFSLFFGLFDTQIISPGPKCSVSTELFTQLGLSSVLLSLILPIMFGPVLSNTVRKILVALEQVKLLWRKTPSQVSLLPTHDTCFPFLLTLIHTFTYSINMIVSETLFPQYIDIFSYMLLKYSLGFSFSMLYPIVALSTHKDLREEVVRVYKDKPGVQEMTREQKEQEIGKEMLKHLQ